MKTHWMALLLVVAGWLSMPAADKIGIIDPMKVLQNTIKGKEVISRLEATRSTHQKKLEAVQKEIESLEKEVASPALGEEIRSRKTLEIQSKRTNLSRMVEDSRNDLTQKRQKEFEALQKEIYPVIEKVAKDEGFTIIFDISTAGIAYANLGAADITDKVIKAFDAHAAIATPKPK